MFLLNGNIHVYMWRKSYIFNILISIDYLLYFHISYIQKNPGGPGPPRPLPPLRACFVILLETSARLVMRKKL